MGLSQRTLVKAESISRELVQRRIASGHLATLPDGTIDEALFGSGWQTSADLIAQVEAAVAKAPEIPAKAESQAKKEFFELLVPRGGIEPPTLRFSVACSTN
jgi:hypothetical protein